MLLTAFLLWATMMSLTVVRVAPAMEAVNVATPSYGLVELPAVIAMRNGYFRSEGLEVQKIQIEPDLGIKALLAGEVNFSLAWDGAVRAAASGLPVKLIAAIVPKPLYVLMTRPEIRSATDLRGKTLGVDSSSSPTDYLSRLAVRYLGLEPDGTVRFVEVGNSALRLAALKAREIHGASFDMAGAAKAEEQGMKSLVQIADIVDYPVLGVAVTSAHLAKNREQTKKLVRALLRGARFIRHNRAETIRTMQHYLKITAGQAAKTHELAARYFTEDGMISDRVLALSVRRAREELQFSGDPALDQVADWSLLREILEERRKVPFWLKQYDP